MIASLRITRPLGARGQVVVPKDIRDRLGLRQGDLVAFEVSDRRVEIKAGQSGDFLKRFYSLPLRKKSPSPRVLKKMLLEQYGDLPR